MIVYRLGSKGLEPCVEPGKEKVYMPPDPTDIPWVAGAFVEESHPLHSHRGVVIVPTRDWPENPSEMLRSLGFVRVRRQELRTRPLLKAAIKNAGLHAFDDWQRVFCLCHRDADCQ